MNFVDISTLNLTTELDVLKRGTQRYSTFLYQHKDVFFADNARIGNNDQQEAEKKFINLLTKAIQENISLVVAPEYSCPKSVIDIIIRDTTMHPPQNKIWALGGESLNKDELKYLAELDKDGIHIYFEDVHNNSDKNYVDPLYYIFRGQHSGIDKLIIIIQFKSKHMGGLWLSQLEPDNLIEGNNVYIIKNNTNSVRLMSFICSQAMNFDAACEQELVDNHSWIDSPFLLLSIQFNPNPSHKNFIAFKEFALSREKRELITLNWGYGTTYVDGKSLYEDYNAPRSGIYFKTSDTDLDFTSPKIIANHNKGLYFLQVKRTKRVYFIHRSIDLIRIENKSVHIIEGVEEQQRREGPTAIDIFNFDQNMDFERVEKVNDGHINFLTSRGVSNAYFLKEENTVVDKERLLNLSTGKVKGKEVNKWADIIHLTSFGLDESDECNNRITYLEDTYQRSEEIRSSSCNNIFELDAKILPDGANYPHSIKRLANKNISLAFAPNANAFNYKYNLVNGEGNIEKATVCFLGNAVGLETVNKVYDELQKLFEAETAGKDTIVVFYKRGDDVLCQYEPKAGSITQIPKDKSSIL